MKDWPLVSIANYSVTFPVRSGDAFALRELNMVIKPGQTVGLVGESGSGKTLTALSIIGFLPDSAEVEEGEIRFEDTEILESRPQDLQRLRFDKLGYIPQDPLQSLNPVVPVGDQITESSGLERRSGWIGWLLESARGYGLRRNNGPRVNEAAAMLGEAGIETPKARVRQYPHEFSGGMRQRAVVVGELSRRPRLLVADEPTTALDATVEKQVLALIRNLVEEEDAALLLISHDLNVVAAMCESVYVLYAGRLMEAGDREQVFASPRHPYTLALLEATPSFSHPIVSRETDRGDAAAAKPNNGCPFAPRCPAASEVCWSEFPEETKVDGNQSFWCHNPLSATKNGVA